MWNAEHSHNSRDFIKKSDPFVKKAGYIWIYMIHIHSLSWSKCWFLCKNVDFLWFHVQYVRFWRSKAYSSFTQEENEQDNFAYKFLNKRFPVFAHQIYNIHPQFKLRFRGKGPLKAPCETCSLILASFTNLNNMIRKYIISCTFTL